MLSFQINVIVNKSDASVLAFFAKTHVDRKCDSGKISLNPTEKRNIINKTNLTASINTYIIIVIQR